MELLLSEAQPIPSHAIIALFAIVLGGAKLADIQLNQKSERYNFLVEGKQRRSGYRRRKRHWPFSR